MSWTDLFTTYGKVYTSDPRSRVKNAEHPAASIPHPDAASMFRQDTWTGKNSLRLGNDLIDFNSAANRLVRSKEYERLRSMPEIEQAMNVIADEACIAGEELVSTLFDGLKSIQWLAENKTEDFLVYCWDFERNDYTIGVAYNARKVKRAKTVKVTLDNGTSFIATHDHLVLLRDGVWSMSSHLKAGDTLMPFYRVPANQFLSKFKTDQFDRVFTMDGWKHERQFIEEWKSGWELQTYKEYQKISNLLTSGLSNEQIADMTGSCFKTCASRLAKHGFTPAELTWLSKKNDRRRVINVSEHEEIDVYDLSVKEHKNFCGEHVIFHNCQKNDKHNVFDILVTDEPIRKELNTLFFHRKLMNMNRTLRHEVKKLAINGDGFWELKIDTENPKKHGILGYVSPPAETMFRLETNYGEIIEFQQGDMGPDLQVLKSTIDEFPNPSPSSPTGNIRFHKNQVVHMRLGEQRKQFYPYGQSIIEPARGVAHQLRMMEDSMVVYRITRAPERRIFYIDVGQMPPHRSEAFMERMQDLLKKRKVAKPQGLGSSAVDEKWHPPAVDEDIWVPIKQNSQTRVDTLPGAANLGEVDDTVFFRTKLYMALGMPFNYFSSEDANATKVTLSSQNLKFAKVIERIQEEVEDALWEIADRHLKLKGYPPERYDDLRIVMTPPSAHREVSMQEVIGNRIQNATSLKSAGLYPDYETLTRIMKHTDEEAQEIIAKNKIQKLEEARLAIITQNPQLSGIGTPGDENQEQMGTEPGMDAGNMPTPDPNNPDPNQQQPPMDPNQPQPQQANKDELQDLNQGQGQPANPNQQQQKKSGHHNLLPTPTKADIKRFNMEIFNYEREQDVEDIDYSDEN